MNPPGNPPGEPLPARELFPELSGDEYRSLCRPSLHSWTEEAPELLRLPFWSPELCSRLILAAEEYGDYREYGEDREKNAAPGQEIRLHLLSRKLLALFVAHLREAVFPVISAHWWPLSGTRLEPRTPFIIKCSSEGQPDLDPHHDSSLISLSIKLNDDFGGGELEFPRQRFRNTEISVGDLLLFPSRVTHVHRVLPVTRGDRFGLTCWLSDGKFDLAKDHLGEKDRGEGGEMGGSGRSEEAPP